MTAGLTLDLSKAQQNLVLNLSKRGVDPTQIQAQVAFNLDVSGSYRRMHENGATNDLLKRLTPWGMVMDVNKAIDVFTFSDGADGAHHVGVVTPANVDGFIRREVIGRVPGWCGGTDYSFVVEKTLAHFGWTPGATISQPAAPVAKRGFFGGMFGGSKPATSVVEPPVVTAKEKALVLFNTDGACNPSNERRTYEVLKASQDRGDRSYFLFLGYANQGADFSFIKRLADDFSNVGLVVIEDLLAFVQKPDDELYDLMIGDEMLVWLKA